LVAILVGSMLVSTLQDPTFSLADDTLSLKCFYGTRIGKTQIEGISLYEHLLTLRAKTNGSSFLGAHKGNFTSDELGPILVCVKENCAPWICIMRRGDKSVFICLSTRHRGSIRMGGLAVNKHDASFDLLYRITVFGVNIEPVRVLITVGFTYYSHTL